MKPVLILTDSTADLSLKLRKQRNIYSLPLLVQFGEEHYRDGVDLTTKDLYRLVEEKNTLPKTAAISPGQFMVFFEKYLKEGYQIVYISIGAKISSTYQSAIVAKNTLNSDDIYVIDSKNLSSGIALLVLKATDLRDKGLPAHVIKEKVDSIVDRVRSQFAIKTLDYLHKGGRASGTAKLVGSILGIKPIIQVRNGKLDVYRRPAGKMSRALDIMLNDFFAEIEANNLDLDYVMITHSLAPKQAIYMIEKVQEQVNPKHLIESYAGCVISSHCGAGTIGILYIVKH